jgi:hypothetical protein
VWTANVWGNGMARLLIIKDQLLFPLIPFFIAVLLRFLFIFQWPKFYLLLDERTLLSVMILFSYYFSAQIKPLNIATDEFYVMKIHSIQKTFRDYSYYCVALFTAITAFEEIDARYGITLKSDTDIIMSTVIVLLSAGIVIHAVLVKLSYRAELPDA